MNLPASVGACILFSNGYGDFCSHRLYAIVSVQREYFILAEIDMKHPPAARHVRRLKRAVYAELAGEGSVTTAPLPEIPITKAYVSSDIAVDSRSKDMRISNRLAKLKPLIDAREEILGDSYPERKCNELALAASLHETRARWQFFWLAAYNFEPSALAPAYWNSGQTSSKAAYENGMEKKRGPKPKNPEITPPGWPFNHKLWPDKIMAGWKKFARPGIAYQKVYALTILHEFGCMADKTTKPAKVYHSDGETFPSFVQFRNHVISVIGQGAWIETKYGTQTIRNKYTPSTNTIAQHLINLLEEVQWDGQVLQELPADLRDPSQPGKPIVRVVATCGTCGGPVGVGYDYGAESKWGYLMALLCMAMKKSEFGALFGVDISDEDWPAYGVMAAIRGDRGPAIGRAVTEIVGEVLGIWQEWAASYDPIGKANAEAGHYKTLKIDGKPRRPRVFRSPIEIIRDDIRMTVAKFRSADMSHRLDPEQARRLPVGTPRTIWNDLMQRGLYAGQIVPFETLAPLTLPCHAVSIREDGVRLGGLRYLSPELLASGLLEQARGDAIPAEVYAMNMATKFIWMHFNSTLARLTAVPVRINAMDISHSLTLEESMLYQDQMAASRRYAEQEALALEMYNEGERTKDHKMIEKARQQLPSYRSSGRAETIKQHRLIFKRK